MKKKKIRHTKKSISKKRNKANIIFLIGISLGITIFLIVLIVKHIVSPRGVVFGSDTTAWKSNVQAWIYPGDPACNAPNEYHDGRTIDTLKPEYLTVSSDGTVKELTVVDAGCNAYSAANAADIKKYSQHQYITVSSNATNMRALFKNQSTMDTGIQMMKNELDKTKFTGIELDFEQYEQWTAEDYQNYLKFVDSLGNTLHASGYKVMVDGESYISTDPSYQWRYSDFNRSSVDYVVIMEYDWEYPDGVGSPVSPFADMTNVTNQIFNLITDHSKVIVGIPSYGYHGPVGSKSITIDTNTQSQSKPGYATAVRDTANSAEMHWTNGNTFYDYNDSTSMDAKRSLLENLGVQAVSVWHLGGNQWFNAGISPTNSPTPIPSATPTPAVKVQPTIMPTRIPSAMPTVTITVQYVTQAPVRTKTPTPTVAAQKTNTTYPTVVPTATSIVSPTAVPSLQLQEIEPTIVLPTIVVQQPQEQTNKTVTAFSSIFEKLRDMFSQPTATPTPLPPVMVSLTPLPTATEVRHIEYNTSPSPSPTVVVSQGTTPRQNPFMYAVIILNNNIRDFVANRFSQFFNGR